MSKFIGGSLFNDVSVGNSTLVNLDAYGIFTGIGEEVKDYSTISVFVFSNIGSATNGLRIEWSVNNIHFDGYDTFTIPPAKAKSYTFGPEAQYFRIVYTNGQQAQSQFRLQVIYHKIDIKASSHRVSDNIVDDDDTELVKAVITGRNNTLDKFVNLQINSRGQLQVATADVPEVVSNYVVMPVQTAASATSLLVAGTLAAPIIFNFNAHATLDTFIIGIKFIATGTVDFGANKFLNVTALTNGVLVTIRTKNITTQLFNLTLNEEFVAFGDVGALDLAGTDILSVELKIGGSVVLKAGSNDNVRVAIRDNLAGAASYFKCYVRGYRQ